MIRGPAALLLLLLLAAGCAARRPGGQPDGPNPGDAAGLAGTGRVTVIAGSDRGRAAFDFRYRRPDRLRLEFRSPLGPAVALLDLDGDHFLLADFRQRLVARGRIGNGEFERLTGIPAPPERLIPMLLGAGHADVFGDPPVLVEYRWPHKGAASALLPEEVAFRGPGPGRSTTIRFTAVRQLDAAACEHGFDPPDLAGLEPLYLDDADGEVPSWLR
jgi:hypothetical protein